MCAECEAEVEAIRPSLDRLLDAERAVRKVFQGNSEAEHAIRLACTVVDAFHSAGHDLKTLCLSYSLIVQRLLALEEITGMGP